MSLDQREQLKTITSAFMKIVLLDRMREYLIKHL